MTLSEKDTHGATLAPVQDARHNPSTKMESFWRAARSDVEAEGSGKPARQSSLAPWFWWTFAIMAALSILMSAAALWRQGGIQDGSGSLSPNQRIASEASAAELESLLDTANRSAAEAVMQQIGPMLDAAYQPAYDAIPAYTDFHYSVWGQYAELGTALIGNVGDKLEETLFDDLDTHLESVGAKLEIVFASTFEQELATGLGRTIASGTGIGPMTAIAITDATHRMMVTAPVRVVAVVGGGAIARTFARRIAYRLSVKAAANLSGRWVMVGTGASGGALLCSWTGPLAALCAAAGGIGAYLVADYGIVMLDEYWNRSDFEDELRAMIDDQKAEHRAALENAVLARAIAVQEEAIVVVEQHDFTLRELSGVGNAAICRTATDLVSRYDLMRGSLRQRNPGAMQALRAAANELAGDFSIRRLAREITENLEEADHITITSLVIEGNLPTDQRADRDVSGHLHLNDSMIAIPRINATEDSGFRFALETEVVLGQETILNYALAVEQHLRIWRNLYFGGNGTVEIFSAIDEVDGLEPEIEVGLRLGHDDNTSSVEGLSTTPIHGAEASLSLGLRAVLLPELQNAPNCP